MNKINEIGSAGDYILAYKILKDLGTKWEDFQEFKDNLIDKEGKRTKEKGSITSYKKIVFNLKRLMSKVTKSNLGHKIISAYLLKENLESNTRRILLDECTEKYVLLDDNLDENYNNDVYIETFIEAYTEKYI